MDVLCVVAMPGCLVCRLKSEIGMGVLLLSREAVVEMGILFFSDVDLSTASTMLLLNASETSTILSRGLDERVDAVEETEVVAVVEVAKVGKGGNTKETFVDTPVEDGSSVVEDDGMGLSVDLRTYDGLRAENCFPALTFVESTVDVSRGAFVVASTFVDFASFSVVNSPEANVDAFKMIVESI